MDVARCGTEATCGGGGGGAERRAGEEGSSEGEEDGAGQHFRGRRLVISDEGSWGGGIGLVAGGVDV